MLMSNVNPYSLNLSGLGAENFSVISFLSQNLLFNSDYALKIVFKRQNTVDLSSCIRQPAYLKTDHNIIHGVITEIKDHQSPDILCDELILSSPLSLLNIKPRSAVYADSDFVKLMATILSEAGWVIKTDFDFLLKETYPARKYIAQYQETDYEFILRQCANWGIFFSFIQKENKPLLLFSDDIVEFEKHFPQVNLPFNFADHFYHDNYCIQAVSCKRKLLTKTVRLNDYNPDTPSLPLKLEKTSSHKLKSFGIDYRPYEFYENKAVGQLLLNCRLEYYDCNREIFSGITDRTDLQLGQHITIENHDIDFMNGDYHIIGVTHEADIKNDHNHYLQLDLLKVHLPYRPKLNKLFQMPDTIAHITSAHVDEQGYYYLSPYFDERQQENTNPVRLNQPMTGKNSGFHFPIRKGTDILISHINGDPDRPIIMGVIPNEKSPNPVTDINSFQHIIQTTAGHMFLLDDHKKNPTILISTPNQTANVQMNNDGIMMQSVGDTTVHADKMLMQNTSGDYIQTVGNDHDIQVQNQYYLKTDSGNITLQSGNDLTLDAQNNIGLQSHENLSFYADNNININSQQNIGIQSSQINIRAKGDIYAFTEDFNLKSQRKIIISQAGASIVIDSSSITLNAQKVSFNTSQFSAPQIQVNSASGENVNDNYTQTPLNISFYDENANPLNSDLNSYFLETSNQEPISVGNIKHQITIPDVKESNPTIKHEKLPAIAVNGKQQPPQTSYPLSSKDNKINCLREPIYKRIIGENYNFTCESLSDDEIHYFKQRGNNVLIFIHGYNVDEGEFSGEDIRIDENPRFPDQFLLSTSGEPCTYPRMLDEIVQQLQKEKVNEPEIDRFKRGYDATAYDSVNGTEARNWLLNMEYNVNCAALGKFPFPWNQHALNYTRILFIKWPGYVPMVHIPGSHNLNFGGAELNAIASAHALVPIIKTLKDSGLTINIIAHSLGNLVTLKMLDIFGRVDPPQSPIGQVIMWEAAIGNDALSSERLYLMEAKITNDMEYYFKYLNQIADPDNVPSSKDYYAKSPFSYFPYAAQAAKQFTVLYSNDDDVLKYSYQGYSAEKANENYDLPEPPLGYSGLDTIDKSIGDMVKTQKIKPFDQTGILLGHSMMRIPSEKLFKNIYMKWVINKENGVKKFGKYNIN